MKKIALLATSIAFTAAAAHAQPAPDPAAESEDTSAASPADAAPAPEPATPADSAADAATPPAESAAPAEPATPAAPTADAAATASFSDEEIDNFAEATVKVQAINKDAAIAPDQKQTQMQAAVTGVGLDPAKYNEISKAAATDAALRAKIQTAMSKYAGPPQG